MKKKPLENKFVIADSTEFGFFRHGGSQERNITDSTFWGAVVANLIFERVGSSNSQRFGLSSYLGETLLHPWGEILERLNPFFQQLMISKNFFEFLQLSSRIVYDLSNFPPITRGSAAVTGWLDIIADEKFNIPNGIRPLLYDWIAFFEIPEQYSEFYIISTSTKYLKTIPSIYEKHKEFFDSIPNTMMKNPNDIRNLQVREKVWEQMKSYIHEFLSVSQELTAEQKKNLESIIDGRLRFRQPSTALVQFASIINQYDDDSLTYEILCKIVHDSGYTLEKLQRLKYLYTNTTKNISYAYLQSYGNSKMEEELNADWFELQIVTTIRCCGQLMRLLPPSESQKKKETDSAYATIRLSCDPKTLTQDQLRTKLKNKLSFALYKDQFYYIDNNWIPIVVTPKNYDTKRFMSDFSFPKIQDEPRAIALNDMMYLNENLGSIAARFDNKVDILRKVSLANSEDLDKVSVEIVTLLWSSIGLSEGLGKNLQEAIWSGGVKIQDLSGLTLDDVKIIASDRALELYRENKFILARDILANPSLVNEDSKREVIMSMSTDNKLVAEPEPTMADTDIDKQDMATLSEDKHLVSSQFFQAQPILTESDPVKKEKQTTTNEQITNSPATVLKVNGKHGF